MSTDNHGRRTCDCCGRLLVKAHRIYKGTEYCQACYEQQFARGICPTCQAGVRYHVAEDQVPECQKCTLEKRECGRCHRPTPRAALIHTVQRPDSLGLNEGPVQSIAVCASCVPYFRDPEPCGICEKLSSRLSGAAHLQAGLRACPICIRKDTHATCSRCRKHRRVASIDGDRVLCKACAGLSPASHPCPRCEVEVPGAGAHMCASCGIAVRLRREQDLRLPLFHHPWVAELFMGFGQWSHTRSPANPRVPANVMRSLEFFLALDQDAALQRPLRAEDMLRVFDSKTLRANLNASTYLQQQFGFVIEANARSDAQKRSLIASKLSTAQLEPWHPYLQGYAQSLAGRAARTASQYLATAEAFCRQFQVSGPFSQEQIVAFLVDKPGARANLGPWVSYVQRELGWAVTLPPKATAGIALKADARQLTQLLEQVRRQPEPDMSLLSKVVALAFGYSESELAREVTGISDSGDLITANGPVQVPGPLRPAVNGWARLRGWAS